MTDIKNITKQEFYQLEGLLTLAANANRLLRDIDKAALLITGDEELGLTTDAIYCEENASDLLESLGIEVLD